MWFTRKFSGFGRTLGRVFSPNFFTSMALILGILSGLVFAGVVYDYFGVLGSDIYERIIYGLMLLFISGIFDGLDGLVARTTNKTSKIGAYFDSMCDRVVDAALFFGLGYGGYISWHLAFLAVIFTQWISYTRAKGEVLGVKTQGVGLMERQERVLFIATLLLLVFWYRETLWLDIGIQLYLILVFITFIYRALFVARKIAQVEGRKNQIA